MTPLAVSCRRSGDGWTCDVTVGDDAGATHHQVTVDAATLEDLASGAEAPDGLVEASFRFLLEREPRESILRRFELVVVGRYFPEWTETMRRGEPQH